MLLADLFVYHFERFQIGLNQVMISQLVQKICNSALQLVNFDDYNLVYKKFCLEILIVFMKLENGYEKRIWAQFVSSLCI